MKNDLKQRILDLMEKERRRPADVAKLMGISRQAFQSIMNFKNKPSDDNLEKIAEALNVPVSYFYEDNSANQTAGRDNNGTMTQNIGTASSAEISRLADKIEILSLKMDKIIALLEKFSGGR